MPAPLACHHRGPPGPLAQWTCIWDEKDLGVERDFQLMGMERLRLLRLRPDYCDVEGWKPKTRAEFMTVTAREALALGQCEVIGGFVRDWIIRGDDYGDDSEDDKETPRDINLRLWPGFDLEAFVGNCKKWGLHRDDRTAKIGFVTPSKEWFFVDYVFDESFEQGEMDLLSIDMDVNSFAVSADKGLHKFACFNRPISKTYGNMKRKVAYLVECDSKDGRKERVKEMQRRGWKVIAAKSGTSSSAKKSSSSKEKM